MALKLVVASLDEVDESLKGEYKEVKDPKSQAVTGYALDLADSIEVHPAAKALKTELGARRISEKQATDTLKAWQPVIGGKKVEDVVTLLDRIPELEALAEGKTDDGTINKLVDAKVKQKIGPIERERDQFKTLADTLKGEVEVFKGKDRTRSIADHIRDAAGKSGGFLPGALEDAIMYGERMLEVQDDGSVVTKDNVGVTPGVGAAVWLSEMQPKKAHWWGTTQGGGARGGQGGGGFNGPNPFTHEGWNMTAQGEILKKNRVQAEQLAKSAGTSIGGPRPAPRK